MNFFHLFTHDVADKVGNLGVLGAIAAGLAMVALLAGVAKIKSKSLSKEFPNDPEAQQAKYLLAFNQLQDATKDSPDGVGSLLSALKSNPAAYLAIEAFGRFKNSETTDIKASKNSNSASRRPPKGGRP